MLGKRVAFADLLEGEYTHAMRCQRRFQKWRVACGGRTEPKQGSISSEEGLFKKDLRENSGTSHNKVRLF
jgi:hypothetical protein